MTPGSNNAKRFLEEYAEKKSNGGSRSSSKTSTGTKGDGKGKSKDKTKSKDKGKTDKNNNNNNNQRNGTTPGPKPPKVCAAYYKGYCAWGAGCPERHMNQKDLDKWAADNKAAAGRIEAAKNQK